ncbi:hypothetical protein DJ82_06300 [Halorubrum sp. Ib24]|nr:hypothetical protein DJ82_06300 [Halorubrum sp. Ib24]
MGPSQRRGGREGATARCPSASATRPHRGASGPALRGPGSAPGGAPRRSRARRARPLLAVPRSSGVAALLAALATAALLRRWSRRRLGGVSGDVLGATNELARVAALHAGVIAWTRF